MLSYNTEILNILLPRSHEQELHGYYGGVFSPDKTKFLAYTYVRLDEIDFEEYSYTLTSSGYSSIGTDTDITKKYLDDHSYQMKSLEECIEQGIYKAYSVKFNGAFYEGEWFINNDITFFGEQMDEEGAKAHLGNDHKYPNRWQVGSFGEGWSHKIPGTDQPIRNVEREEFPGMPFLVSHIKIERKTQVNWAFAKYMNATLIHPFLRQMRIRFFDEFVEFISLFGEDYYVVFPNNKAVFLVVTMAKHRTLGYRLVWFFYDFGTGKFYRWIYPQPRYSEHSYHYSEDLIIDLQAISDWNDPGFLNSSRTMDDQRFWSEYVLKTTEGQFHWLKEIPE